MKTVKDYIPKAIPEFSPAGRLIKGMTSPIRHNDRVDMTKKAASAYIRALPISEYLLDTYSEENLIRILAWADHCGIGGPQFERSATATTRHPAFQNLGKGRKFATDGSAWVAASNELWQSYDAEIADEDSIRFINKDYDHYFEISINDLISLVEADNWSLWNMAKEIFYIHTGLEGNPTNWPDKEADQELFSRIEEACQFINKLLVHEYDLVPDNPIYED